MKLYIFIISVGLYSCGQNSSEKKLSSNFNAINRNSPKVDSIQEITKRIQGTWKLTTDDSQEIFFSHDTVFQKTSIGVDTIQYKILKTYINGVDTIVTNPSTYIILYNQSDGILFHEFITNLTRSTLTLMGQNESQSAIYKRH